MFALCQGDPIICSSLIRSTLHNNNRRILPANIHHSRSIPCSLRRNTPLANTRQASIRRSILPRRLPLRHHGDARKILRLS